MPEQYPIVGKHLLESIKEVLGGAVDQPVLDAWKAAYQQLADIFIDFEKGLYKKAEDTPGGWVHESDEIVSFFLEPKDKGSLPPFKSGQYISMRVFVPELGVYQPRQYNLSDIPDGKHFRISVKKESAFGERPAGRISTILHKDLPEGSELDVSMPFGDFTLDIDATTPVVLISGGVGITPMISMLSTIVGQGKDRPVAFVHAARRFRIRHSSDSA
jgi:nitric oxide dioxygenase